MVFNEAMMVGVILYNYIEGVVTVKPAMRIMVTWIVVWLLICTECGEGGESKLLHHYIMV